MATPDPFASMGGGVQVNGGWVPKDHPSAGAATGGAGTPASSFSSYSTLSYNPVDAPSFVAPTRKKVTPFAAPTQADMLVDPSYQFRVGQGQTAAERAMLRAGVLRTGNALADLVDYGQRAGSQEYQAIFDRAAGVWDRNRAESTDAYNADVQGAQLNYAPRLMSWQAAEAAKAKAAEANFDRSWQNEIWNRDNTYRVGRDAADDAYRNRVYTGDDAYRYRALDQDMEQFLIDQGNY